MLRTNQSLAPFSPKKIQTKEFTLYYIICRRFYIHVISVRPPFFGVKNLEKGKKSTQESLQGRINLSCYPNSFLSFGDKNNFILIGGIK